MRITVLGGRGLLGRHLVPLLEEAGYDVTVSSRSTDPSVDLASGAGVAEAIDGAEVIFHLASDAVRAKKVDLNGTQRMLQEITDQRLVYVSIVGVDRHPLPYYRVKYEVEQMIERSGVEHTIVRATQFHDFVAYLIGMSTRLPIGIVPRRFVFQPIDTAEAANHIAALVEYAGARAPDLGGPEVLGIADLARSLMTERGVERPLIQIPIPGKVGRAFRQGIHTNPDRAVGKVTWADYLASLGFHHGPPY